MSAAEPFFATCPPRLVVFDLDGTLIDSVSDLTATVGNMLVNLGRSPAGIEEVRQWAGNGARALVRHALTGGIEHNGIGKEETEATPALFVGVRADSHALTEVYPGVADILRWLKRSGAEVVLITNKPRCFAAPLPDEVRLGRYFRWVIGGDTPPRQKPDPAVLLFVTEMADIEPEDALFVDDSCNDVLAAKAAGVYCATPTYGYNHDRSIAEGAPTLVIDNPRDLLPCADQAAEMVLPDGSPSPPDQRDQAVTVSKLWMKITKALARWRWHTRHHPPPDSRYAFASC